MSDSDEFEQLKTIAAMVDEDSDEEDEILTVPMPVLFLSHGAGPSLLIDKAVAPQMAGMDKVDTRRAGHSYCVYVYSPSVRAQDSEFAAFYKTIADDFPVPLRILVVSAHWEDDCFKITSHEQQSLQYDYFGFPAPLYSLPYAPPGDVRFAKKVRCRGGPCAGLSPFQIPKL